MDRTEMYAHTVETYKEHRSLGVLEDLEPFG